MKGVLYVLSNMERTSDLVRQLTLRLNIMKRPNSFIERDCTANDFQLYGDTLASLSDYTSFTEVHELYCKDWITAIRYETLSYNEALCFLLGITPSWNVFKDNEKLSVLPRNKCSIAYDFYITPENDFLKRKYYDSSRINTQEFLEWAVSIKLMRAITNPEKTSKARPRTVEMQDTINNIAKEIMKKFPKSTQESLADDVHKKLKEIYPKKCPSSETIRTKKLKKYPDFS